MTGAHRGRAPAIVLQAEDRESLRALIEAPSASNRVARRGAIVLALAEGHTPSQVAAMLDVTPPTVRLWRRRYLEHGVDGLREREGGTDPGPELRRILEAAERTMSIQGFCATRISDIADEAGIASATVIYYFRTKQELLIQAMLHASRQAADAFEADLSGEFATPLERMSTLIRRLIPDVGSPRNEYLLELDILAHVNQYPELLGLWELYQDRWITAVRETIDDGVASGAFSLRRSSDDVSETFIALVNGLGYQIAVGTSRMTVDRMRDLVAWFAADLLGVDVHDIHAAERVE
jgi:AcrR family transcriptional regulator